MTGTSPAQDAPDTGELESCAKALASETIAPFPSRSATIFEPNERALKPWRKRDAHWPQAPR
jgi:hypothetical protein